jgi:hypothetical protein
MAYGDFCKRDIAKLLLNDSLISNRRFHKKQMLVK